MFFSYGMTKQEIYVFQSTETPMIETNHPTFKKSITASTSLYTETKNVLFGLYQTYFDRTTLNMTLGEYRCLFYKGIKTSTVTETKLGLVTVDVLTVLILKITIILLIRSSSTRFI